MTFRLPSYQAMMYSPSYLGGHIGTGTWLLAQHRFREAVGPLSTYKLKDYPESLINRAVVLHRLEQHAEARKELENTIELLPNSLTAKFNLGQLLLLQGYWVEALRMLREVDRAVRISHGSVWRATSDANKRKAERERVALRLEPLLNACEKWQQVSTLTAH